MNRGTNQLPGYGYPEIPARTNPGLPASIPGGIWGPVEVPSRDAFPINQALVPYPGRATPGGIAGLVNTIADSVRRAPSVVAAIAPAVFTGVNNCGGGPLRNAGGGPIEWYRKRYANTGGLHAFHTGGSSTTSWTSNDRNSSDPLPSSTIPVSVKSINAGGYRREQYVDCQLFPIIPRWVIFKPVPAYIRGLAQRPNITAPYQPRLTSYAPSGSYGSTTNTLRSKALSNLLSSADPTYGSY